MPEAAKSCDRFLRMRPTIVERRENGIAKWDYQPEIAAPFAKGDRTTRIPTPAMERFQVRRIRLTVRKRGTTKKGADSTQVKTALVPGWPAGPQTIAAST